MDPTKNETKKLTFVLGCHENCCFFCFFFLRLKMAGNRQFHKVLHGCACPDTFYLPVSLLFRERMVKLGRWTSLLSEMFTPGL